MSKLLSAMLAGATALVLSASVSAADQSRDTQSRDNQTQTQPNTTNGEPEQADSQANGDRMKGHSQEHDSVGASDPARNKASDQANRPGGTDNQNTQGSDSDPAYAAELKKCDPLQGDSRQKCITAAKKKAGQM